MSIASGLWDHVAVPLLRALWRRLQKTMRPTVALVGTAAEQDRYCLIFVRDLKKREGETAHTYRPARPSELDNTEVAPQEIPNVPEVCSSDDMSCAVAFQRVLAQAGKSRRIRVCDPSRNPNLPDATVVWVGGGPDTTDRILRHLRHAANKPHVDLVCEPVGNDGHPRYGLRAQGFDKLLLNFVKPAKHDFGAIIKSRLDDSDVWVLFGLGARGTAACGERLERHARSLGALYGSAPFTALVHYDGSSRIAALWPRPRFLRRILSRKSFKLFRAAFQHDEGGLLSDYFAQREEHLRRISEQPMSAPSSGAPVEEPAPPEPQRSKDEKCTSHTTTETSRTHTHVEHLDTVTRAATDRGYRA